MKTRSLVFGLLVFALFLLLAAPAFAQEATPEPTAPPVSPVTDVTVVDGGTAVVSTDSPDPLAPLLAMAGSVFAIMELLKNAFLGDLTSRLDERDKAFANWAVASALALVLIAGAPDGIDIFTATGYPNPYGDLFGRVVTALAVGGGNAILHAMYEFLRTPRAAGAKIQLR